MASVTIYSLPDSQLSSTMTRFPCASAFGAVAYPRNFTSAPSATIVEYVSLASMGWEKTFENEAKEMPLQICRALSSATFVVWTTYLLWKVSIAASVAAISIFCDGLAMIFLETGFKFPMRAMHLRWSLQSTSSYAGGLGGSASFGGLGGCDGGDGGGEHSSFDQMTVALLFEQPLPHAPSGKSVSNSATEQSRLS